MLHWFVTAAVGVLALAGWLKVRGLARRLEQLTQNYWDLRYQYSELRATVRRLDPEAPRDDDEETSPPPATAFIPLSSLKRGPADAAPPGTER